MRVEAKASDVGHIRDLIPGKSYFHYILLHEGVTGHILKNLFHVALDAEGLDPVVSGADGSHRQIEFGRIGTAVRAPSQHAVEHFVDRAVAADRHDLAVAHTGSEGRQFRGVVFMRCVVCVIRDAKFLEFLLGGYPVTHRLA